MYFYDSLNFENQKQSHIVAVEKTMDITRGSRLLPAEILFFLYLFEKLKNRNNNGNYIHD